MQHQAVNRRTRRALTFVMASALLYVSGVTAPATADEAYPNRPIRMVVGFAAGGGPDIVARLVAPKLTSLFGRQVVVDNRPGAGGSIAEEIVAKAAPDGYTLLACSNSISINPFLKKLPYDPVRDLIPISLTGISAQVLVVQPHFAAKNVRDLITLAKSKPGQITYASSGTGAGSHLSGELFKLLADIDLNHIPYKGGGQGVASVLGGETDMMFAPIAAAIPHVRAGRLRAMAVTTSKRTSAAPEIPTMVEAGVPEYESFPWYGLLVPAKTPQQVTLTLEKATANVLVQSDVQQRMQGLGVDIPDAGRKEFARFLKVEMQRWSEVIRRANLASN
jgi:tripartite-type tricarboxylate transporter receptor subunit TctC